MSGAPGTGPELTPEEKRAKKRNEVIKEIVKTEQSYVTSLKVLAECYISELKQERYAKLLEPSILQAFAQIEIIIGVNSELLKRLQTFVAENTGSLGEIFLQLAPFLRQYSAYCTTYEKITAAVDKCREKHDKLDAFFQKLEDDPSTEGRPFCSYLIMPVQRIPRYNLLLKELINYTDQSHEDYEKLCKALEATKAIADFVNQNIKLDDNRQITMNIAKELVGLPEITEENEYLNVIKPGRKYVDQADMVIVARKHIKHRRFFLFTDVLYICKTRRKRAYRFVEAINLWDSPTRWAREVAPSRFVQHAFQVVSSDKTITVFCKTEEQKKKWVKNINEQVMNYLKSGLTFGNQDKSLSKIKIEYRNRLLSLIGNEYKQLPNHDVTYTKEQLEAIVESSPAPIFRVRANKSHLLFASPFGCEIKFLEGEEFDIYRLDKDGWWLAKKAWTEVNQEPVFVEKGNDPPPPVKPPPFVIGLVPSTYLSVLTVNEEEEVELPEEGNNPLYDAATASDKFEINWNQAEEDKKKIDDSNRDAGVLFNQREFDKIRFNLQKLPQWMHIYFTELWGCQNYLSAAQQGAGGGDDEGGESPRSLNSPAAAALKPQPTSSPRPDTKQTLPPTPAAPKLKLQSSSSPSSASSATTATSTIDFSTAASPLAAAAASETISMAQLAAARRAARAAALGAAPPSPSSAAEAGAAAATATTTPRAPDAPAATSKTPRGLLRQATAVGTESPRLDLGKKKRWSGLFPGLSCMSGTKKF